MPHQPFAAAIKLLNRSTSVTFVDDNINPLV